MRDGNCERAMPSVEEAGTRLLSMADFSTECEWYKSMKGKTEHLEGKSEHNFQRSSTVDRLALNQEVEGSSPSAGAKTKEGENNG